MTSSDSEYSNSPPELQSITLNSLPEKSRLLYEKQHTVFTTWCNENKFKNITENVILAYFSAKSVNYKSSTLWSMYSMLKSTLAVKNNIDISTYVKLNAFLKKESFGHKPNKSKVFNRDELITFFRNAPNESFLLWKVCLLFGIAGACRRDELRKIKTEDIIDKDNMLIINISDSKNSKTRTFTITNEFLEEINPLQLYRQYIALRPEHCHHKTFFINYKLGKCSTQVIGVHMFAKIPSLIAKYLKLPYVTQYTGHCYRRTSAALLANSSANMLSLKRLGGWKSSTGPEVNLTDKKCTVCSKILDEHIFPHPALRVIVCFDCLLKYDNVLFKTNEDGTESNCRWCTQVANKKRCFYCTCVFCENCLERNFGRDFALKSVQNRSWKCFICDPKPIWKLRTICTKAMDQRSSGSNLNKTSKPEAEIRFKTELIQSFINETEANTSALHQTPSNSNSFNEKATNSTEKETNDELILSETYKNNVHEKLIETQKELLCFINLVTKESKRFEKKFDKSNLVSYEYIEKLFSRVSLFCDQTVRKVECIKNRNEQRFLEISSDRIQGHVPIKKGTVLEENCGDIIISSNSVKIERVDNIEENNIDINEISFHTEDIKDIKENSIDIDESYIFQPNLSLKKDPLDIQPGSSSSSDNFNDFLKSIHKSVADNVNTTIKMEKGSIEQKSVEYEDQESMECDP